MGQNPGNIGVLVVGNFDWSNISPAAEASLRNLLLHLLDKYDLDFDSVKGHGERTQGTNCPGENLQGELLSILKRCEKKRSR